MNYEDIEKANSQIRTLEIERTDKKTNRKIKKEYAEVNQRIKAFRMCCPDGCITTEIISPIDDIIGNGIIIIKACVCDGDGKLLGTGYAMEERESSYINQNAFVENAETSAVGRALGMCGFGIDTAVASAEEINNEEQKEIQKRLEILLKIKKIMADKKILPDVINDKFGKNSADMTDDELNEVLMWLEEK